MEVVCYVRRFDGASVTVSPFHSCRAPLEYGVISRDIADLILVIPSEFALGRTTLYTAYLSTCLLLYLA